MSGDDVLVLRKGGHGISTERYAEALRERLPADATVVRPGTPAAERAAAETATVITGHNVDAELVERADNLRLFACASAGYESLPLETLAANDVAVTNASGVHGPNIAEHVVGSMLAFAREFGRFRRQQDRHEWRRGQASELYGSTVTVVGLGAIGEAVVERLDGFGVDTIGARYTPEKGGPTDEVVGFDEAAVHDAFARSDYVVVACPLTDETEGLVGAAELATLEPHAVLVNVGRGPIVDTDALVDALQSNALGGAALDVTDPEPLPPDHELWDLDNVFLTPHTSGHTPHYYERVADILAANWPAVSDGSLDDLENRVQ
ncbi:D-2-hydroxyacid dehydrogenase [Candidatus Halobonum tyrrellensis]|uniref:D-isomer specific 2-hydroxyacid dehydrogenase NAD-binding protein n=1 Tax=Candidatus Halobonum tyrrellensis G22 TaxID=1324957 RepID=V4HHB3_9EURY|nr:D-2-hydroxyacid dehydrogenase [Candidatus Halobonum tyrrellensis]ESP90150.1 D-isomer specific 2-hydroxyacid dehydrogenase NAD-binding protein [Candidatus Halobonum tyrrellensis G22]